MLILNLACYTIGTGLFYLYEWRLDTLTWWDVLCINLGYAAAWLGGFALGYLKRHQEEAEYAPRR